MHPKNLSIQDFSYILPEEKIAAYPLPDRDASKLLIYKNGNIRVAIYQNLDQYLPENSLLIFNETKVVEARLTVATTKEGEICAMQKGGVDPLSIDEIDKMVELAVKKCDELRVYIK